MPGTPARPATSAATSKGWPARTGSPSGSATSSPAPPTTSPDITAARTHALGACYAAASQLGLPTLADPGYDGAGIGVYTPVKQPADGGELDVDTRTYNMLLRSLHSLGERGFALLTERWRTLEHVTASSSKIGKTAGAALVLTHFEHGYLAC